ncbi:ADP-ribosylglycohydrolase family protein [Rhodococcus fascians]|uniref:ADP-ribosylglycohydrolase family protein n=1 Tax=Rhodococcoides fascians TaxID=1828 RepID=UPI0024B700DA|nr:ADP-ribosylglycohydrolase family protein [Rhodococcus fascians]MDJ0005526.1 ADP-ribosylglycohydrolase family protein [Rhodococcus fascians]
MTDATTATRYANALVGVAAGDAWGYQVEFTQYANMPSYPVAPPPKIWRISDDTQMTFAVHDALVDVDDLDDIDAVTAALTARFQEWKASPQNNRAPGRTCMGSLTNLAAGAHWYDKAGAITSAGCGAVMRLVPTAFADENHWLGLTALQALITHKHPRAVTSALLLAAAIRNAPARAGNMLIFAMADAADLYDGTSAWLDDPYLRRVLAPLTGDVAGYLVAGLDDRLTDALTAALSAQHEIRGLDPAAYGDPCFGIGQGWESATAVSLALLVADQATGPNAPLTPADGLGWAATSNGDSDSIASMAGALIGATSSEPSFWTLAARLDLKFERRYAKALTLAARAQVSVGGVARRAKKVAATPV